MTIVNFMPVYAQAPVALEVLRGGADAAAAKAVAEDAVLVVPEGDAVAETLTAAGAKVVCAPAGFGFVYTNDTAMAKVVAGQKAIPSDVTGAAEVSVVSGEAWLAGEDAASKLVWAEGADAAVEVAASTTTADVLSAIGASADDVKAVYFGFPQNQLVAADKLAEPVVVAADYVRVFTNKDCMAKALADISKQFHRECCGRCFYGNEGGHQIATIAADIVSKKGKPGDLDLLRDLCPVMAEQALCEVGRETAKAVMQILDLFSAEIEAHITKKQCPAGQCKAFMTFHILVSKCTGCGDCLAACEDDAIMGKAKFVHVIDQKACVQCGKCLEACPKGAVVMAGAEKPKTPPKPIPCRAK